MGGSGSTRWDGIGTRHSIGECLNLDLREIGRYLRRMPVQFNWRWSWTNGKEASISIRLLDRTQVFLICSVQRDGRAWMPIKERIALTWTSCSYGGERPWFRCPGCERRVRVIYAPPGNTMFRCRSCHNLAHTSQQQSEENRLLARVRAIQRRLGGDSAQLLPWQVPPPPKGMHARTYTRLVDELIACEQRRSALLAIGFNRLMKRSDRVLSRFRDE